MKRPLFLFLTLLLLIFTFLLDHLARHFYLYWSQSGTDAVIHFLGGLGISLLFLWLVFFSGIFGSKSFDQKQAFVISLSFSLIAGILWEIYEYRIGFTAYSAAFVFDSLSDLSMDVSGGLLGYFIAVSILSDDVN